MNAELEKQLVEKYPKIFSDYHGDYRQTCMAWGCECGDGWYWLIDNLCGSIQSYIDCNDHRKICQVTASQIKEKFGALRFYFSGGDDYIEGMVSFAEYLSESICEVCGKPGKIYDKGWVTVRCDECRAKDMKRHALVDIP